MNTDIKKLAELAQKKNRTIIGLMSGTSLDGLDIALCDIEGHGRKTKLTLKKFITQSYPTDFREEIKSIFCKKKVDLQKLCLLHKWIAETHADMILNTLENWSVDPKSVDLIASHGQTIYHAPEHLHQQKKFGNATLQIGDGDYIAVKTGIITISDFRQKNIAAGGEGAPLAAYGDLILFKDDTSNVILLNIGGIANLTYLPAKGNMLCTDTGPGNTLIDAWIQKNFTDKFYDEDGKLAAAGKINTALLKALKQHSFFRMPYPKTTGPELFNLAYTEEAIKIAGFISVQDTIATLTKFTADCICIAINKLEHSDKKTTLYVSGGGIHNPILMSHLTKKLKDITIKSSAEKNINPDAKEAILFAILANECVAGNGEFLNKNNNNLPAVSMGKISLPL